jgi:hypothetical protein
MVGLDPIEPLVTTSDMPLKITSPTWQEKPAAVYTLSAAVGQAASAHAGNPISGVTINAAATPTSDLTFSIVSSSKWHDRDRTPAEIPLAPLPMAIEK